MEDYEIRDIMRRSTRPDLVIEFYFDKMRKTHDLRYTNEAEHHAPAGMTGVISNRSDEPALYAVALVFVDVRISVLSTEYERLGIAEMGANRVFPYRLRFLPNKGMPFFKEQPTLMPALGIIIPENLLYHDNDYTIGYEVRAPGCTNKQTGRLIVEYGKRLSIIMDDPDRPGEAKST